MEIFGAAWKNPLIRARGIRLGGSGVGLVQLRHREDLMARRSGRQEEGRREAPRQALRGVPHLQVLDRLLRALGDPGRAAADSAEVAAAVVHAERVNDVLSLRRHRPPKDAAKAEKGVRKRRKGCLCLKKETGGVLRHMKR
jgi:hypothetical protein